ncbi:MAG: hypothetical protein DYG96_12505 [Chlorobi bacterium CHB2]|nr:hypothetical protein [Polyangiaceae bacterium]MCE7935391.1 hypothetical protein [Chlorobi bacterium CHB2]
MSETDKQKLTFQALGLLNEQVQARIVHYKGELETSPELDAITAQVVAQIKGMQAALGAGTQTGAAPDELEEQQSKTMSRLLGRLLATDGNFATQNLKTIGRRIAKLFFESELHEKSRGDKDRVIRHPEQGVYYVLSRYKNRLRAELEGFEYGSTDVKQGTFELLAKIEKDLQVGFLSRRSPELNRVMHIHSGVLLEFLQKHLPPRLEAMCRATLRAAETGRTPGAVNYKVLSVQFPDFRAHWERIFMEQMVNFCGDELLAKLSGGDEIFLEETVRFFTDPHLFSDTAEVICDGIYDFLCLEGFLDLPVDWRVKLARN